MLDGGRGEIVIVLGSFFFFFQAEDGIRDDLVTGVQTCALPILTFSFFLKKKDIVCTGA